MGSRPLNVSPSMLGIRSRAFGEDSTIISSRPFPPKLPVMSLVPRSSGNVGYTENGFTTPRSRGRSAIYSMARTPYSRVHPASSLKGVGPIVSYDGPSTAAWEQDKLHGSGQGALKRRSSVLDNDVGSVGPIRRIRHKPSLLSSRGLSLPVPNSPLSIPGNGVGLGAAQHPSSLTQTQLLLGKSKENSAKASIVNGDNSVPSTSFPPVPSKSSEMASKILQQLEKLASPKEKSSEFKVVSLRDSTPTKLSPSMLRGRALRSLETVESPRFLENVQDDILDTSLPDALGSTSQKQNKAENGPLKLVAPLEKSVPVVKGIDYRSSNKDTLPGVKTADSVVMDSVTHPPQKKRAFQMSAHEDYLELDDDYPDGAAPTPLVEEREKGDASVAERKTHYTEAVTMEKPPSLLGFKSPASSSSNQNHDLASSVGPVVAEKGTGFAFPSATFTSMAAQPAVPVTKSTFTSDKSAPPEQLKVAPPMFGLGGKAALPKEPNATPPAASFASVSSADKVPQFVFASSFSASESAGLKFSVCPDAKLESSSSFPTVDATDSVPKVPDMDKADNKNYSNAGVTSSIAETALSSAASSPTPTASIGASTSVNTSILNNGSVASSPSSFSSPIAPFVSNNIFSQPSSNSSALTVTSTGSSSSSTTTTTTAFTAINSRSILSTSSVAAPSFSTAPIFKSGSIVPSTSASLVTAAFGIESEAAKTRPERSVGNLKSSPFIGTSAANASAGSSIFAFNATDTSTANNKPSSTVFGTGSGSVLSAQASPAGTGAASFQFSSSVPSASFGLAGNTAFSSGSSLFAASTPASELSNSGTFGVSSSASSSEANSSSAIGGTTSSLFSSSWQPTKSSIFSSAFNSKSASAGSSFAESTAPVDGTTSPITGFSFPASTASVPTTASPPTGFSFMASTASVAASSPSTVFPFTASTAAAASTSSSTGFAFASSTAFAASTPAAVTSSASVVFGSNPGSSSGPTFSFTSAMATPSSQPVFGNPSPGFLFNSVSSGTNDQMNMEDSMAEDTVQASTPTAPIFGHPPVSPPQSGFVFGSATPSAANPFQFGGQQSSATPSNPSPFQATNSLGGSFSVGAGGGDKSGRKIVRVSRNKARKK
ncbi:nuclear pore complex protein NUP1 isoform X2 [Juglans regia]|nr:nuclear pore complex protein NUP1 isoform X2 [Juglans regia]